MNLNPAADYRTDEQYLVMSLLRSLGEPDSRALSVGKKRGFNQFNTPGENIIAVGRDSSDEDSEHLGKRARYNGAAAIDDCSMGSSIEASQDVVAVSEKLTATDLPQDEQHIPSLQDVSTASAGNESASGAPQLSTTWNQGTLGTIRTSFASRAVPVELLSSELHNIDTQMSANPEIDAATASYGNSKTTSDDESSEDLEINAVSPMNSLPKIPSSKRSENETERESAWSQVRARFPSSFGNVTSQKQAEEIIKRIPETSRGLQPLEIGKTGLNFFKNGQVFKLPERLYQGQLPPPPLPILSFRDPRFGFASAFVNENRSLSQSIDYELLVKAFQEYLRRVYGHLPDELTRLVGSSKYVIGKKSVKICVKFLDDIKNGQLESRKTDTSRQKEPAIMQPEQLRKIESQFNGYDSVGSKNPEPDSMARMQRMELNLFQTIPRANDEKETPNELSDQKFLMRSRESQPKNESEGVHVPKRDGSSQNPLDGMVEIYHPSSEEHPFVRRCLTCAQTDHETAECPYLTCATCGLRNVHFTAGCPKTQRCSKCLERGHQKSDCSEKLIATAHGDPLCDNCKSSKHLESACHYIWRSFKPGFLKTTRFVSNIPIYCYCCGAEGHFGLECGLLRSPLYAEGYSWSKVNWRRYVDPDSNNRSLSAGQDYSLPVSAKSKKNFSIKGRAQNMDDKPGDENEDIAFIRKKVTKIARPLLKGNQHIKFETGRRQADGYVPRPHLGPFVPDSHQQPLRARRPMQQPETYFEDHNEITYNPRDDSARHIRERSFTPPPRFREERYETRSGGNHHPSGDMADIYRPYETPAGESNPQARLEGISSNDKRRRMRGGLAQRGRPGRGKSQRGRKH